MRTILAACLVCGGCISPHGDSTATMLHRTVIPRISFRQAIAADVVEFFDSAYKEYRQPDDPDLRFVAEVGLQSMTVGGPIKEDPQSMRIDEGMTATAPLWEEMQRFAQLAALSIAVEGRTVIFKSKKEAANQAPEDTARKLADPQR